MKTLESNATKKQCYFDLKSILSSIVIIWLLIRMVIATTVYFSSKIDYSKSLKKIINQFTHNYGVSIDLFTIFFYSLLFPMRWYQSRSFKKAQKNAPKMKEVQDRMKELQRKGVPAIFTSDTRW